MTTSNTFKTNSNIFKLAHVMTKKVIQLGDSYKVTFGACLKMIKADLAKHAADLSYNLFQAKKNSNGPFNKGAKVVDLINNEMVKIILARNEVATVIAEVKKGFFSKLVAMLK